jgi:hypothetical protein
MGRDAEEEEEMKLRDAPTLARRFRFPHAPVGREDLYILVTPRCWPSPIAGYESPRPALYMQVGKAKSPPPERLEPVCEFKTPKDDPEYLESFIAFAEAETPEERERAAEIWSRLVAWHGEREKR